MSTPRPIERAMARPGVHQTPLLASNAFFRIPPARYLAPPPAAAMLHFLLYLSLLRFFGHPRETASSWTSALNPRLFAASSYQLAHFSQILASPAGRTDFCCHLDHPTAKVKICLFLVPCDFRRPPPPPLAVVDSVLAITLFHSCLSLG